MNPQGLTAFVQHHLFTIHTGIIKDDFKNICYSTIVFLAVASRVAVRGGLDFCQAQHILDLYLAYMDKSTTTDEVLRLPYEIAMEYATLIQDLHIPDDISPALRKALLYIQSHIEQSLSLHEVAAHVNMTETYFSKTFSKEVHMTFKEYVAARKMEEAKRLLLNTKFTLAQISEHLSYSSQNYFQNVFRRYTGMTPGEYRKERSKQQIS